MNVIDVFDIATSTWYKQATYGEYPDPLVNPCAVAASAPDGTSTNIYMYGGQNLTPYMNQTQYGDMWILTVPSFTWVKVDTTGQSVPPARVGHTCNLYDSQIIVIGGYNTDQSTLGCDTGFYVFDASNLTWVNTFHSMPGGDPKTNPQNLQAAQQKDPAGVMGSFGYQVPNAVQSVIGGGPTGGATITKPAQTATAGPWPPANQSPTPSQVPTQSRAQTAPSLPKQAPPPPLPKAHPPNPPAPILAPSSAACSQASSSC